ncbi:hypothetical protein [Microbacterium pumilum]|uniref:Uncharacterized protein n=1 Tax=Microbacterium pumilum TaxID=344165 RepID=A0ABP5EJ11_9MICO
MSVRGTIPSAFTRERDIAPRRGLASDVAARSGDLPTVGGAAPTLILAVRVEDLASDTGWASVTTGSKT